MNAQQTIIGKSNFYARHGITIRDIRNYGAVLGLSPSRHFMFLASMCVTNKMKY